MRPTTATDNVFDFQALLHPGTLFEHPKDVVTHPSLTLAEKRAILASWASDASAIASCRQHRRHPGSLVRAGRRPPTPAGRQAEAPLLRIAGAGGLRRTPWKISAYRDT